MADPDEPDDLDRKISRARKRMDAARADLLAGIYEALAIKRTPARIARHSDWSPDYIKKIGARDKDAVDKIRDGGAN